MIRRSFRNIALVSLLFSSLFAPLFARPLKKRDAGESTLQQGLEAYQFSDYQAAFKLLQAPARAGNPKAEYRLGVLYLDGEGVEKNEKKGMLFIQKAAKAGDPDACDLLGGVYLFGSYGWRMDVNAALKWKDRATAAYRALAAKGDPDAAWTLAGKATVDAEKYKWYREAYDGFQRQAQKGNIHAMESLAEFNNYGYGMDKDPNEAKKWYLAAIAKIVPMTKHGNAALMYQIGSLYFAMSDYPNTLLWYEKAVAKGSGDAAYQTGLFYTEGWGVKKDEQAAFKWYQKSAQLGDLDGVSAMAYDYANGEGVPQNGQEAIRLYQKCADRGNSYSLVNIGDMYRSGNGVQKDINQAIQWYERAAAAGYTSAGDTLGDLYRDGNNGVPQDYSQALHWYQSCPGYYSCNLEAGKLLINGKTGTPDPFGALGALRLSWYQSGNGYHPDDFYDAWGETIAALKKLSTAGDAPATKILTENAGLVSQIQQIMDQAHQQKVTDAKADFDKDLKSLEANQDFLKVWNGGYGNGWRPYLDIDYQYSVISDALALNKLGAYPDPPSDAQANIKAAEDKAKNAKNIQDFVDAENLLKSAVLAAPWYFQSYEDLAEIELDLHEYQAASDLWTRSLEAGQSFADDKTIQTIKDNIAQMKTKADAKQKAVQLVDYWYQASDLNARIQNLSQAVQLDPDLVSAKIWLAWAYYDNKEYKEAHNAAYDAEHVRFGGFMLVNFTKDWVPAGFSVNDYLNLYEVLGLSEDFSASGDYVGSSPLEARAWAAEDYQTVIACCPGATLSDENRRQQALAHYNLGVILSDLQPADVDAFIDDVEGDCTYMGDTYSECSNLEFGYDITDYHQRRQAAISHFQQAVQLNPGKTLYQQTLNQQSAYR